MLFLNTEYIKNSAESTDTQPLAWPRPFFIHHWTSVGRDVASFMLEPGSLATAPD